MGLFRRRSVAAIMNRFHSVIDELEAHEMASRAEQNAHEQFAKDHSAQASLHADEAEQAALVAAKIRELVA